MTAEGKANGIYASDSLSAKDATLTAKSNSSIALCGSSCITLDGCDVTAESEKGLQGIYSDGDITIKNNVSVVAKANGYDYGCGIESYSGNISIEGGTVTAEGKYYGISASDSLSAKDATLTAKSNSSNALCGSSCITLDGCNVTAESEAGSQGIYSNGDITIKNNVSVVAKANDNDYGYGIYSYRGSISIEGGTVTAEGHKYGISAYDSLSAKDATLTAIGTTESGLYSEGSVTLTGGQLDIQGNPDRWAVQAAQGITYNFGEGDKAISVVSDIAKVTTVACSRTFTTGKPSTMMLPFSIAAGNVSGGKFYKFTDVAYNTATQQWEADMDEVTGTIAANTPYVFVPEETELTFNVPDGGVTLNTTADDYSETEGEWTFTGTYSPLTYGTEPLTASYVYGFAGADQPEGKDEVEAGQFVRAGSGATIPAFRAYLQRETELGTRQAASRSAVAVPDVIVVRLHQADGSVTAISGELKVDGNGAAADYYTLDGRRLGSKPAGKGLYIRNGKKVIVK